MDDGYMGSGKRLRRSIRKYGIDNHNKEILELFETRELLIEAEIKAITPEMITDTDCMNLMGGGQGGYISEEHHLKMRKGASVVNKILLKEFWSDIERKKKRSENISKAFSKLDINKKNRILKNIDWNGKKHSDETKQKMSEAKKGFGIGENNSQYGTCWITKDGTNKKIKKEEIETYLNEGWVKGRITK
jgi:hypothetical protein